MKASHWLIIILSLHILPAHGQQVTLDRIEPPNWWIGMQNKRLQVLVHGTNISVTTPTLKYEGVTIREVTRLESKNYLFLTLEISKTAQSGSFDINFTKPDGKNLTYKYTLQPRKARPVHTEPSVNGSDVIYLITPDRFANGNSANDNTDDTIEKVNRNNPDGRHGGDLKGIIDHLDYIDSLGVTALWLNPIQENDQSTYSYHGYAISDFYKTDSRFGTNGDYLELSNQCHQRGIKIIMDMVFNHCGSGHWWMNDLPASDWLNQWPRFTRSNFTNITISDPYHSDVDHDLHSKGWFDTNMPDLNQTNPQLAIYLIQNSIWWIEYASLDGIRMDTYPYPDKNMMARWVKEVLNEYPNFYIVGETWEYDAASISYWSKRDGNKDGYVSNLSSVSDYPLYYALLDAFGEKNKIYSLYETLAYDGLYDNPFHNKVFVGNHDQPRPYNAFGKSKDKVKLSLAFILTTRGIPQIYYGDELLFDGPKPDGVIRKDFPGGFVDDVQNLFLEEDRTEDQKEVHSFVKKILQWRKGAKEIHYGKLKHYKPLNEEVYVYFRYTDTNSTMVILNNGSHQYKDFDLNRYRESLSGYTGGTDIITNRKYVSLNSLTLDANTAYIIELTK